jgi:putative ABC transport system permease protein
MRTLARLSSLWRTLFRKDALDRELDEELRACVATLADRHVAAGLTPEAAERAAIDALGGPGSLRRITSDVRDSRLGAGVDACLVDVRQAWRSLWHARRLAATIGATLALGIGATAAIFSVVRALLIEPLPYRQPDRLVFVWLDRTAAGHARGPMSGPDLHDLRTASRTVAAFGAIWASGTIALAGGGLDPEQLRGAFVTTDFFEVLGADAALGRTFRREDAAPGAHPTILLGWELFERRFGADPGVVGRQIIVDDRPTTVIGVMPRAFRMLLPPDASVPDGLQAWQPFWPDLEHGLRGHLFLRVVGRLRPGVTVAAAGAELDAVAAGISRQLGSPRAFRTVGLHADGVRDLQGPLLVLFAGVGGLLTIACVNVAGLLVARAASRRRETAVRLALGASRGRLLRQSLAEGLLLIGLGALGGLVAGAGGLRALQAVAPESLARIQSADLDIGVVAFTIAAAGVCGLLFAVAPTAELFRAEPRLLPSARHRLDAGAARDRVRAALVAVQVALSVVLLVGAGLLVRTFLAIQDVDPGFVPGGRLTVKIALPESRYPDATSLRQADRELRRRFAAIPGVSAVGGISHLPYDALPNWALTFAPDGVTSRDGHPGADTRSITPGLLETLGVRLIAGRTFTDDDSPETPAVIVDDMLATRLWPGRSAIGQVFRTGQAWPEQRVTVVGVVRHLRQRSLIADLTPQIFVSYRAWQRSPMAYVLATDRDPADVAGDLRAAVAAFDPRLPLHDVRPLSAFVDEARATRRFTMQLTAAFAAAALALTGLGIYGVLAYAVARRQREIGIRRALGAGTGRVVGDVVQEGVSLATAGAAAGLAIATLGATLLRSQLYLVEPHDPLTLAASLAIALAAAIVACVVPARRAAAVDPMDVLRAE